MKKQYQIQLTDQERRELKRLIESGRKLARKITRARILLLSDTGKTDKEIAEALQVCMYSVHKVRKRFFNEKSVNSLEEKPRSGKPPKLDGLTAAQITALACSEPPEGRDKWTLRLLADRAVELELVDSISHEGIRKLLKKNELKPHLRKMWCIGRITPEFIWHMEDVLHQHELPYDPRHPKVNFDERPCQLIGDVVQPIPMEPGKVKREDSEYERNGVCNLFIALEPLAGKRVCAVFQHRTGTEYAMFMKMLSELHYPDAEKIVVIQDNLSTHNPGSFYKTLSPEKAHELSSRFEFHYTPKKASWLNMAEIELSVISKQCLDRRIATQEELKNQVYALVEERNRIKATVNWSFTKTKARQKLERHYTITTN